MLLWLNLSVLLLFVPPSAFCHPREQSAADFYNSTRTSDEDGEAPLILSRYPEAKASGVPLEAGIRITVVDRQTGVDSTSLSLRINGTDVTSRLKWSRYVDAGYSGYTVLFQSGRVFAFGEQVHLAISVSDRSVKQNALTEEYGFTCVIDDAPPVLLGSSPNTFAFANTPVVLVLQDLQSGVDAGSIQLLIQGTAVRDLLIEPVDDTLVVKYTPTPWYKQNSIVTVQFIVADFFGNRLQSGFTFWVDPDLSAPHITVHPPTGNDTMWSRQDTLSLDITDGGLGVKISSLGFYVDGQDRLARCVLDSFQVKAGTGATGYRLQYPLAQVPEGKTFSCRTIVFDRATAANRCDTTFTVQMAVRNQKVMVVPPLITPNGDGINDHMQVFVATDLKPQRVRIFTLENELVADLAVKAATHAIICEWDGRDTRHQLVRNGVYIVQLLADTNSYQCTITVAR
jgi:hypothetical protein